MNGMKLVKWIILATAFVGVAGYVYHRTKKKQEKKLFVTAGLKRHTITQIINTTGTLEAKGTLNIGSLITGVVQELFAKENQVVKKGELLATIDNGKGDTDVKRAAAGLKRSEVNFTYQKAFFKRQKELYEHGHISEDEFEQAQRSYDGTKATVEENRALLEKATIDFNNTKITSPINGIIIKKHVSIRQGVANFSPPTILYTIAEDIRKMKVELEIDETDIGFIKLGQRSKLLFDTYPHKSFYGNISEISSAPMSSRKNNVVYKATIMIDNKKLLLKPGMTAHGRMIVDTRKNVLAVPGHLFAINKKLLEQIAHAKDHDYKPLSKKEKEKFRATRKNKNCAVKTIWVLKDNAFVQRPVEIGATDNTFFEVVSGISENDLVIIDVEEPDAMKKLYKQFFGGGLTSKKS